MSFILDVMGESDIDNGDGDGLGIDYLNLKDNHYELVKVPKTIVMPNGSGHGSDESLIAIVAIFMVVAALCGLICFMLGSGVGGGFGYKIGKKKGKKKKFDKELVLEERNVDDELLLNMNQK